MRDLFDVFTEAGFVKLLTKEQEMDMDEWAAMWKDDDMFEYTRPDTKYWDVNA
jgi:hypothetical protein